MEEEVGRDVLAMYMIPLIAMKMQYFQLHRPAIADHKIEHDALPLDSSAIQLLPNKKIVQMQNLEDCGIANLCGNVTGGKNNRPSTA